ncbi:outer membrane protein assembly factor BamB family protein [Natrinema versiforme]|nr:PQQ-binding-like beta-propeller repeat protein [Natrinema versiforme]
MEDRSIRGSLSRRTLVGSVAVGLAAGTAGCLRPLLEEGGQTAGNETTEDGANGAGTETEAWPAFGADRGGSGAADVTPPGDDVSDVWTADLNGGRGNPVVADGTVYCAARSTVRAFEADSGEETWSSEVGLTGGLSPALTVAGGVAFATPGDGFLYAFDAGDGERFWSESLTGGSGSSFASPRLLDDVLVAADDDRVSGHDASSGEQRWSKELPNTVLGTVVDDGTAYLGILAAGAEPSVYAFDAESGERRWTYDGVRNGSNEPTVVDGTVYGGGAGDTGTEGYVYAVDAESGAERWGTELESPIVTSPAVTDGSLYVTDEDGGFYELGTERGDVRWRESVWDESDRDGNPPKISAPAVADGRIHLGTLDGRALAADASDGSVTWSFSAATEIRASPAVADGRAYIVAAETLYALGTA